MVDLQYIQKLMRNSIERKQEEFYKDIMIERSETINAKYRVNGMNKIVI